MGLLIGQHFFFPTRYKINRLLGYGMQSSSSHHPQKANGIIHLHRTICNMRHLYSTAVYLAAFGMLVPSHLTSLKCGGSITLNPLKSYTPLYGMFFHRRKPAVAITVPTRNSVFVLLSYSPR